MAPVRLGLIGLGMMGKAHLKVIQASSDVVAVAATDPTPAARAYAEANGLMAYERYEAMLDREKLDGVIVASPNAEHVPTGLACIARGIAVLIEKPLSETLQGATALCAASEAKGVPILVGHHRRHNPLVQRVRQAVAEGLIGRPSMVQISSLFLKPASYFDLAWRKEPGAGGTILINLIHEIDLVRFIFGEIETLQAMTSSAIRGNPVEDTVAVALRFTNGALGTISLSDTAATPYSWDLSSGEFGQMTNTTQTIPRQKVVSHVFAGTEGSVTLPTLTYFNYRGDTEPGWLSVLKDSTLTPASALDSYTAQLAHFAKVARREAEPLVSGRDGLGTIAATLAAKHSGATGAVIKLS
jgi:predicted dehydrogenase